MGQHEEQKPVISQACYFCRRLLSFCSEDPPVGTALELGNPPAGRVEQVSKAPPGSLEPFLFSFGRAGSVAPRAGRSR